MNFHLTTAPFRVAKSDVTAGTGRVLPGSLRSEKVIDLSVEGLDGSINLVVLGSQGRLISSVLHIVTTRDIVSTTGGTGRSGQTRRSRRTLRWIIEGIDTVTVDGKDNRAQLPNLQNNRKQCTYSGANVSRGSTSTRGANSTMTASSAILTSGSVGSSRALKRKSSYILYYT